MKRRIETPSTGTCAMQQRAEISALNSVMLGTNRQKECGPLARSKSIKRKGESEE